MSDDLAAKSMKTVKTHKTAKTVKTNRTGRTAKSRKQRAPKTGPGRGKKRLEGKPSAGPPLPNVGQGTLVKREADRD